MIINLSPVRMDETLTLEREGDQLWLNGELFDFSPLAAEATLPVDAINSDWFVGPVSRIAGELHLTLRLPHGANAPESTRFPSPIKLAEDGSVDLPEHSEVATRLDGPETFLLEAPDAVFEEEVLASE